MIGTRDAKDQFVPQVMEMPTVGEIIAEDDPPSDSVLREILIPPTRQLNLIPKPRLREATFEPTLPEILAKTLAYEDERMQKANKRDQMMAKIRRAEKEGIDVDDLGGEEELHSSDWSGSECGMLDEQGNPWPKGQQISLDDGMGGYIPYNVDQIHTLPQLATPAGPMTEESARAHEKFLSTKSLAHYQAVAADEEKERRQAEKAARE